MLELKEINKSYYSSGMKKEVLKKINVCFRKCEFVSILGESGSGKTTLLNIIGGLDIYDSGDLTINGKSTLDYSDKDWDNYRNTRIGFVFQNYNLINHLSVYDNIRISLSLSCISKNEAYNKVINVLDSLGLSEFIYSKPNELSGGQMQRVAIARALVNDPDIIVADEPTGALDSKTSIDIMNVLKNISKEKLVIMVTHNERLAKKYSTRILYLSDGCIVNDSNPVVETDKSYKADNHQCKSMSLKETILISFHNLLLKKKRTVLTSIASSIGIIGIALVLSISNGVNKYIKDVEKSSISDYPIIINKNSFNVFGTFNELNDLKNKCDLGTVCITDNKSSNYIKNNIKNFKIYIDNNPKIKEYTTSITYSYDIDLNVFTKEYQKIDKDNFQELSSNYTLLYGVFPKKYNEIAIVLNDNNAISKDLLNILNIDDKSLKSYSYEEVINNSYKLILNTDYYEKDNNIYINHKDDYEYLKNKIDNGVELKVVGILKDDNVDNSYIGYKDKLTYYLIDKISKTDLYHDQINNKYINILTNQYFNEFDNTYESLEKELGIYEINNPSRINIYPKDYKSKEKLVDLINKYNKRQSKENKIVYSDMMKSLVDSITRILNIISYILISFASISLIVSSIMISIITYISVLERTKEIGILRSIGASKKDIIRLFNSETFIEGLLSGVIGILITIFINLIINTVIYGITKIENISILSLNNALILIILSILLSVISGLRSSKIAAKKNPVDALRCE